MESEFNGPNRLTVSRRSLPPTSACRLPESSTQQEIAKLFRSQTSQAYALWVLGKVSHNIQATDATHRRPENVYACQASIDNVENGLVDCKHRARKQVALWSASAADR